MTAHSKVIGARGLRHWMINSTGLESRERHLPNIPGLRLTTPLVALLDSMFTSRLLSPERLTIQHVLKVHQSLQLNRSACNFGITCMVLMLTP